MPPASKDIITSLRGFPFYSDFVAEQFEPDGTKSKFKKYNFGQESQETFAKIVSLLVDGGVFICDTGLISAFVSQENRKELEEFFAKHGCVVRFRDTMYHGATYVNGERVNLSELAMDIQKLDSSVKTQNSQTEINQPTPSSV